MIILGVVLIVLALIFPTIHFLLWVGIVLVVIGLILLILGSRGGADYRVGGRRYWY